MYVRSFVFAAALACLAIPGLARAEAVCLIGSHANITEADAETSAAIVCDELRKRGVIGLSEPRGDATAAAEVYRVTLRPLGEQVYLSLAQEMNGAIVSQGQLMLRRIEEVPVAAPRLAEAVLSGKNVAQTATVSSLVGQESRQGKFFFNFGIVGMALPRTDVIGAAGLSFGGAFETEDFAVLSDLHFTVGQPSDDEALFTSFGVGGRYYLGGGNWSPFFTGGFAFNALSVGVKRKKDFGWGSEEGLDNHSQSGLGAWAGLGIQALRHYESRLTVDLRAGLPFFEVGDKYYVPITLGVTYAW